MTDSPIRLMASPAERFIPRSSINNEEAASVSVPLFYAFAFWRRHGTVAGIALR